jgi:hypothetical protein
MRRVNLYLLVAGAALGLSTAHAEGVLQGLQMDVMDPDETAAEATARIALPRPGSAIDDASPDYTSRVTEQAMAGSNGSETPALDNENDGAPASPESADDPGSGIDVGEPGVIDAGDGVDGGVIEPEPGETIDVDPIEEPIEDPVDEIPIGDITDGVDGGEPGGTDVGDGVDGDPIEEPIGDIIDGGPGGDDVVSLPVEPMPPVESDGRISE